MRALLAGAALLLAAAGPVREFAHSLVLGRMQPVPLVLAGSEAGADLVLSGPLSAPPLAHGATKLTTLHAAAPGAAVACVSARSDRIGTVADVNLDVHIKSVAVLLDARWRRVSDPRAAWAGIAAAGRRFANWENCGAKAEGPPSPASVLVASPYGGYADDVLDGNPGTTFNIVARHYGADAVAAMLGGQGYPDGEVRIFMSVLEGPQGMALVQQGIAAQGGFIAFYVQMK
jgi:hypothetical protein